MKPDPDQNPRLTPAQQFHGYRARLITRKLYRRLERLTEPQRREILAEIAATFRPKPQADAKPVAKPKRSPSSTPRAAKPRSRRVAASRPRKAAATTVKP